VPQAGRPGICRNCGAIVAAGEAICPQCGVPLSSAARGVSSDPSMPAIDKETLRFARAVLTRPYLFTILILIANIFVFLLMWEQSGMGSNAIWAFDGATLLRFGAKMNVLIDRYHQWWRLVTPVFVHVGIIHLLVNMYGLWILGPYVERIYGSAKFVVFWVASGVAGVTASYLTVRPELSGGPLGEFLFKTHDNPSAGASGALFGLIGVLFVFGLKYRHELPEGFRQSFGTGMLPTILLNLFIGFTLRFIDNSAHLGGLAAGAALALVTDYKRPGPRGPVAYFWHVLQIASILLVIVSFAMVARHINDPLPNLSGIEAPSMVIPDPAKSRDFISAINAGLSAMDNARTRRDYREIDDALAKLGNAPSLDSRADAFLRELRSMLVEEKQLNSPVRPGTRSDSDDNQRRNQLEASFNDWQKRFTEWVKNDGAKYGFKSSDGGDDSTGAK
jgi:rhomboid protease GluP